MMQKPITQKQIIPYPKQYFKLKSNFTTTTSPQIFFKTPNIFSCHLNFYAFFIQKTIFHRSQNRAQPSFSQKDKKKIKKMNIAVDSWHRGGYKSHPFTEMKRFESKQGNPF